MRNNFLFLVLLHVVSLARGDFTVNPPSAAYGNRELAASNTKGCRTSEQPSVSTMPGLLSVGSFFTFTATTSNNAAGAYIVPKVCEHDGSNCVDPIVTSACNGGPSGIYTTGSESVDSCFLMPVGTPETGYISLQMVPVGAGNTWIQCVDFVAPPNATHSSSGSFSRLEPLIGLAGALTVLSLAI